MMNSSKTLPAGNVDSARLPLKLAGLFAVSFGLFFILFVAYDLLSGFAEGSAASQVSEQAPPIVIDPRIADDLAKVLASDADPNSENVKDPFSDRGGLTGAVTASTSSAAAQTSANAPGSSTTVPVSPGSTGTGSLGINTPGAPSLSAVEGTKQRYEMWFQRSGINGDVPLDPRIFAIGDLLPVGIVDGGKGGQEVMFFSEAVGKTLSFPIGTMFFDGWLIELRPEGVVFSSNDDRRTLRMRSWARSIKNAG